MESVSDESTAIIVREYELTAQTRPTGKSLKTTDFTQRPDSDFPGNVGICLSGGGSVSMMACLGQLRYLTEMGYISKAKAVSTVSGGSWATTPFTYLPDKLPLTIKDILKNREITDEDFLGKFNPDPSKLTPESLKQNSAKYMGSVVANIKMDWKALVAQAVYLYSVNKVPADRIWTHLIGNNILAPFGLSRFDDNHLPKDFFAYNNEHAQEIQKKYGHDKKYHVYANPEKHAQRPLHLCNFAMFINPDGSDNSKKDQLIAPVQSHAFYTGILGDNIGTDANGAKVGGGQVQSNAFNSVLKSISGTEADVKQDSALALSDITGMSSAFYALLADMIPGDGKIADMVRELAGAVTGGMDPKYHSWSVADPIPNNEKKNSFADAGTTDDTGVAFLLSFDDIDNLVVCVNSLQWAQVASKPVNPEKPDDINNFVVDMWIPPLFGYRPWQEGIGYVKYEGSTGDHGKYFAHNQVFPSDDFADFITNLRKNSNNFAAPATYQQKNLSVLKNDWFGVKDDPTRKVNVLWVHYNPCMEWENQLTPDVQKILDKYVNNANRVKHSGKDKFPNFVLVDTHMPIEIVNLFSDQTAWIMSQQKAILDDMFSAK